MDSSRKTMKGLGLAYEKVQRRYGSGKLISEPLTNYQDVIYSQIIVYNRSINQIFV
jgi:hypothetical protein